MRLDALRAILSSSTHLFPVINLHQLLLSQLVMQLPSPPVHPARHRDDHLLPALIREL